MASLGQDLQKERELRGISLKEISDSTKINLRFLVALEEDRLNILPGRFFIKGILRSYADYLGLDQSDVLNKFYEEEQYRQLNAGDETEDPDTPSEIPKSFKNKMIFGITFVVIVAVLSSMYFIFQKDKIERPKITSDPAPAQKKAVIPPPPVEKALAKASEATEMNLTISFQQETWIQVYIDGELLLDGIKYQGEQFSATASGEIVFNLGNAGGMVYSINDRAGKSLGQSGQVVKNIQIKLDTLSDFLIEDEGAPNGG